jgi:hypothetical protein
MTFRPDPAAMSGTFETSDTSGPTARFGRVEDTTAIFDIARAGDLQWALRSMDPNDETVSQNLVQTSPGLTVNRGNPDEDRIRITAAAQRNLHHLFEHGYTLDSHGVPEAPVMRNQPSPPAFGPATVVDTTTG